MLPLFFVNFYSIVLLLGHQNKFARKILPCLDIEKTILSLNAGQGHDGINAYF